jgi:hypothetical protein
MKKRILNEKCDGCIFLNPTFYSCELIELNNLECPCMTCLVKCICTEACAERISFGETLTLETEP